MQLKDDLKSLNETNIPTETICDKAREQEGEISCQNLSNCLTGWTRVGKFRIEILTLYVGLYTPPPNLIPILPKMKM